MISILMYHRVANISRKLDPLGLSISPLQFEQQMSYLSRNGYKCLSLSDAVHYFQGGGQASTKSFVLTFDDGYQDLHTTVFPILEKYGFTAAIFLVACFMGLPSHWAGQDGGRSGLLLSWLEARDLARHGYILGSHTLSHPLLYMLNERLAYDEIYNSRILLQDKLDLQIDFFSYPYSYSDRHIESLVESAGYKAACAGDSGSWNLFHLWRVPCLRDDTKLSFILKANGQYNKWTALRESIPVQLLRRGARILRGKPTVSHPHPPDV